jgi:hypothetical protein
MKIPNVIRTRNHEFQICFVLVDENTKFQSCLPEVNTSSSSIESSICIPFLWNLETGSLETDSGRDWSSNYCKRQIDLNFGVHMKNVYIYIYIFLYFFFHIFLLNI